MESVFADRNQSRNFCCTNLIKSQSRSVLVELTVQRLLNQMIANSGGTIVLIAVLLDGISCGKLSDPQVIVLSLTK